MQKLAQAVEACIMNSILAQARRIAVSVSPNSSSFSVEDDGHGITASLLPRLAKHVSTGVQRCGSLAALANAGHLTVISKATSCFETFQVTVVHGKITSSGLATQQRSTQGTVVRIKELFQSQPVRKQQMTHGR